jgi:hypothetical protein
MKNNNAELSPSTMAEPKKKSAASAWLRISDFSASMLSPSADFRAQLDHVVLGRNEYVAGRVTHVTLSDPNLCRHVGRDAQRSEQAPQRADNRDDRCAILGSRPGTSARGRPRCCVERYTDARRLPSGRKLAEIRPARRQH